MCYEWEVNRRTLMLLTVKPTPLTSRFAGPFSELALASAHLGGRLIVRNSDTNFRLPNSVIT